MKQKILQIVVGFFVAAVALWYGFREINLQEVIDEIVHIQFIYVLIAILIMVFSHWLRSVRWQLLVSDHQFHLFKGVYPFFSATMVGYAVNNIIPRGGEIAKALYLSKSIGVSQSKIFGTVVLERLLDFLFLILMFGVTSFFYSEELNEFFPGLGIIAVVIFLSAIMIILLFTLMPQQKLYRAVRHLFALFNKRVAIKAARISLQFSEGMSSLKNSDRLVSVLMTSFAIWFCYSIMTWVPLYAFHFQETAHLTLMAGIAIMTISSIGVILPSPGGAGTFHFFCSVVLVNMFGISKLDAMSFATALHLMNFVITTLLGILTFLSDRLIARKTHG